MSSSSSSSSPQTSGSIGRMAEMPDNGNGSGCWNSTAAIARLRNYGGRVVQMSTGRMAAVINKNWPGFRLVSRNFSICNVTTYCSRYATASESASGPHLYLCSLQTASFWTVDVSNQTADFSFLSAQLSSVSSQSPFAPLAYLPQQPVRHISP